MCGNPVGLQPEKLSARGRLAYRITIGRKAGGTIFTLGADVLVFQPEPGVKSKRFMLSARVPGAFVVTWNVKPALPPVPTCPYPAMELTGSAPAAVNWSRAFIPVSIALAAAGHELLSAIAPPVAESGT